jgi:RHS repeat-associated protein
MANTSDITRTFYDEPDPNFSLRTQNFLWGNVAYTQFVNNGEDNDIISQTWYSYDDLGRVEWVAQQLEGLSGIKLVEYTYDYFGKVTEVIYQAGTSEAFHHKYSYDASQRLQNVETSRDGQTWAQQAKYIYYLHGPLKRVEMGDKFQGMDYAYTLHGWLKSVNNLNANDDMGGDGLTNTFASDVFSMQLNYFTGDYVSAKADNPVAEITNSGIVGKSISGNINSLAWRTQKPGGSANREEAMTSEKDMFVFDYDERYQILNAKYGKVNQTAFVADANDAFGLQMGDSYTGKTYDRNGNILGLRRKGENGVMKDDFGYRYIGNSNRLKDVSEETAYYSEYTYNEIGELIRDNNDRTGKDLTIKYDAYGKVSEVKDNGVLLAQYTYNERGQRVRKKVFSPTGEAKTTFYVRDAGGNVLSIYEADESESLPMTQKELPIYGMSRLGQLQLNSDNEFETIYEAKDHLGNVRATFREGKNYLNSYFTDIDNGTLLNGQPVEGDEPRFDVDPSYLDMTKAHSGSLSALMSDGESIEMWLPVQNGDKLFAEVYFNSDELPENGGLPGGRIGGSVNPALTTGSLMSIGSMPNLGGEGKAGAPSININALAVAGLLIKNKTTAEPLGANGTDLNYYQSWVRMELYKSKDDADPISSKSAQIILKDGDVGRWESASLYWTNLDMPDDWCEGFVKVYIENQGSERIWFDDISVEHTHNPGKIEVVSYKDYYPFGAEMRGSCIDNQGRYGYQGDYAEKDEETGWNAFELRMYDPLIGRSTSVDPYRQYHSPYVWVGNNPINMVDPDGGNANPIYSYAGDLLGTDNKGLKGEAIIMDESDFTQGMAHDLALEKGMLFSEFIEFNPNDIIIDIVSASVASLSSRPDWDGIVTLEDANEWYKNGGGQPLFVDVSQMDLSPLSVGDFKKVGDKKLYNFFTSPSSKRIMKLVH